MTAHAELTAVACGTECQEVGHHCGRGSTTIHPVDRVFGCGEMWGSLCEYHTSEQRWRNFQAALDMTSSETKRRTQRIEDYDARKGIKSRAGALVTRPEQLKESLFRCIAPSKWPLEDIKRLVVTSATAKDVVVPLRKLLPSIQCQEDDDSGSLTMIPPAAIVLLPILRQFVGSVNLWHQFDFKTGLAQGHTLKSCRLVPTWLQNAKMACHPLVTACLMAQIHANAAEDRAVARQVVDALSAIIIALSPINAKYKSAGSSALTVQERQMARLASSLLECPGYHEMALLQQAVSAAELPAASADGMRSYFGAKTESTLPVRQLQESQQGFTSVADAVDLDGLAFEAMSAEDLCQIAVIFKGISSTAIATFGIQKTMRFNDQGMPTTFFPASSSTRDLCYLAWQAWRRAVNHCDLPTATKCGQVKWRNGDWRRVVVCWIVQYCQWGEGDPLTGARSVLDGSQSVLRPTLLAHTAHNIAFFRDPKTGVKTEFGAVSTLQELNAMVQSWGANAMIKSMRVSTLASVVETTRSDVGRLLHRLRRAGLLGDVSATHIDAVVERKVGLSKNVLELLQFSGTDPCERPSRFAPTKDSASEE
ncbi:unnamed protein product [Parajaminaea phylloscopi]